MGVHSLWKIVEDSGETIELEDLNHHRLAIDASIWAHQFLKSSKLKDSGNSAALVGFFRRILKLLFYNIKPVFVFDGVAPTIKRKVLKQRREGREKSKENLKKTAEKILQTQLQVKLLEHDTSNNTNSSSGSLTNLLKRDRDAFELPALDVHDMTANIKDDDLRYDFDLELLDYLHSYNPNMRDVNLTTLDQLPLSLKYEVVSELRSRSRQTSHNRIEHLKKVAPNANDFSQLQVQNLMQRNQLTQKYLEVVGINEETSHLPGEKTLGRVAAQRGKTFSLVKNIQGGWKLARPTTQSQIESTNKEDNKEDNKETNKQDDAVKVEEKEDLEEEEEEEEEFWLELFNAVEELETLEADDWKVENTSFKLEDLGVKVKLEEEFKPINMFSNDSSQEEVKVEVESRKLATNMFSSCSDENTNFDDEVFEEVEECLDNSWQSENTNSHLNSYQHLDMWKQYLDLSVEPNQPNLDTLHFNCTNVWSLKFLEHKIIAVGNKLEASKDSDPIKYDSLCTYLEYLNTVLECRKNEGNDTSLNKETSALVATQVRSQPVDLVNLDFVETGPTEPAEQVIDLELPTQPSFNSTGLLNSNLSKDKGIKLPKLTYIDQPKTAILTKLNEPTVSSPTSPPTSSESKPTYTDRSQTTTLTKLDKPTTSNPTSPPISSEPKPTCADQTQTVTLNKLDKPTTSNSILLPTSFESTTTTLNYETLQSELESLHQLKSKQERQLDDPTLELFQDIQHLLQILGIPFIVAKGEAEAQCAYFAQHNLVDGVVSDDSDVLLFGGTPVYRYLFHSTQRVERYQLTKLTTEFRLGRDKLIDLAQLLGSDYALGVNGIGPVTALQVLDGFTSLTEFKDWWESNRTVTKTDSNKANTPFLKKLRKLAMRTYNLPPSFPDSDISEAYLNPEVDENLQPFKWGTLQIDKLQQFLKMKLDWDFNKTTDTLKPLLKHQEQLNQQPKITDFFIKDTERTNQNLVNRKKLKGLQNVMNKFKNDK